jgi:hypothetical protein
MYKTYTPKYLYTNNMYKTYTPKYL